MEFVVVTFPETRGVVVDDAPGGFTGTIIRLQAGMHSFTLDLPVDYTPPSQTLVIGGTTKSTPQIIAFTPLVAAMPAAARSAPGGRFRAKPKKRAARKATPRRQTKKTAAKTKDRRRGSTAKRKRVRRKGK